MYKFDRRGGGSKNRILGNYLLFSLIFESRKLQPTVRETINDIISFKNKYLDF